MKYEPPSGDLVTRLVYGIKHRLRSPYLGTSLD